MSKKGIVIQTPRGRVFHAQTKGGRVTASLEWNPSFGPRHTESFAAAQKFVDSEVLRLSDPYTPRQTGMLIKSGILGTVVGAGQVNWVAPYAAAQYYRVGHGGGQRGPYWFERMKADHGPEIIRGAKTKAGGK